MNTYKKHNTHKTIKVTILATYKLARQCLQKLIDQDRNLSVLDTAGTTSELTDKVVRRNPDVTLLYLAENEGKNLKIVDSLNQLIPTSRAVILSDPNSLLDQTEALKLGVAGIVGSNQSERVLIRAIEQVFDGEVWLNQKLLAQLLDNKFNQSNGKDGTRNFFKVDELTKREVEVVQMIGLGLCNKVIAQKMYISEATIRHHLSSIYSKLQIEDRLNLAIYAYKRQIVSPSHNISV